MDITEGIIAAANEEQLGRYGVALLRRLGELGLHGREAIERALNEAGDEDFDDVEEGMLQIEDLLAHQ